MSCELLLYLQCIQPINMMYSNHCLTVVNDLATYHFHILGEDPADH